MKLDSYTLRARTAPFFLVLLPVLLAILAWFPDQLTTWRTLPGVGVTAFLAVLFAQLGRDRGKRKEKELFELWGGKPTTQLLRHSYTEEDDSEEIRRRQRAKLAKLSGQNFPTPRQEANDSEAADNIYEAAIHVLRERTRESSKFRLINAENVNYGYRRNLWGMRLPATILAGLGATAAFTATYFATDGSNQATAATLGVINTLLLLLYVARVNREWVRLAAFEYAKQLLASVELLDQADAQGSTSQRLIVEP